MASAASNKEPDELPVIYSAWRHPNKSWSDIIMGFIFSIVVNPFPPFQAPSDPNALQEAKIEHAEKMRATVDKMGTAGLAEKNGGFRRWTAKAECDIIETTLKIPRRDDLFQKWGIERAEEKLNYSLPEDSNNTVYVAFPATLLPGSVQIPTEKNKFGCLVLEEDGILDILPKDVPIVLFLHGGGMAIGGPRTGEGIDLLVTALEGLPEAKPVIFISVKYSLAPEYPFPVAPLETCSIVSHFLDHDFKNVHINGVSAGGYLALVGGLEAYRAHSNKSNIKTIFAACPMLNPACDSMSFYQNGPSSQVAPMHFGLWCYQVFFQLDELDPDEATEDESNLASVLGRGSYRTAWRNSKWRNSSLRRIAEPIVDVPDDLKGVKFIITTNTADVLYDDGIAVLPKLKDAGADLSHHDNKGSHWIGTVLDKQAYKEVARDWAEALFGNAADATS